MGKRSTFAEEDIRTDAERGIVVSLLVFGANLSIRFAGKGVQTEAHAV